MKENFGAKLRDALSSFRRLPGIILKNQYSHLAPCFWLPLAIMLLIYICRGLYPIDTGCVLVLDLNGQYVYFYEALRAFIHGDGSLLYSFERALGGEFLGIYAYYIASPLSWLVGLFPEGRMLEALLVIFLIKTGLSGLTFGWYLNKTTRHPNRLFIVAFATLYALSSYAVVQQHNSMWIDALIWLPILTYAIEQLIKEGRYRLFVISLAMTIMSNFYIGYMVCIYVAHYFFYYYLAKGDPLSRANNPHSERWHFVKSLLRIGGASAIAIGISAVLILGAYYSLGFGKTDFTNPDFSFFVRFSLSDLFVKLLPGAYDTVRPAGLPIIYCGVLTLILLPFYYLRKDISVREKLWSTLFIAVFVLSFLLNPLDIAWHGFQKPNWLNYRYSFMLCFWLLVLAFRGMCHIRRARGTTVFGVGAVLILAVIILERFEYQSFVLDEYGLEPGKLDTFRTVWFTIIMVILLCACLSAIISAKKRGALKKYSFVLVGVIALEVFANGLIQTADLDIDVGYASYTAYNDYINEARVIADKVQEMDTSFYRMEKTRQRKTNDNMALNMRGLSCSTSTLNQETIRLLRNMGYASYSNRSKYYGGTPFSDSLLGLKYILSEKSVKETASYYNENRALHAIMEELYEAYAETDEYVAFKNPYALSLAFTVSPDIQELVFSLIDEQGRENVLLSTPMARLNALATALMGEPTEIFVPIEVEDFGRVNCDLIPVSGHRKYTPAHSGADSVVTIDAVMPTDAYLFFYAPTDYRREVKVTLNDDAYGYLFDSDSNRIKALGKHSAGEELDLRLTLCDDSFYIQHLEPCLYYLDVECFKAVMAELSKEQYQIEEFTETHFKGTITVDGETETVLTTIPYDEGWQVYVDGKRVDIYKAADALIAFDIRGVGSHSLELVYAPKIITLGCIISASSLVIFLAFVLFDRQYIKRHGHSLSAARPPKNKNEEGRAQCSTISEEA